MVVFDDVPMGSVAEGGVGGVLAVAEFVVPALIHIKGDRSAPGYSRIAGSVATWIGQTQPA